MTLAWRTSGDKKVCAACAELDGKRDGDGWSSGLTSEVDQFVKDVAGNWKRSRPAGHVVGPPPLHPNCRCRTVEVD